MLRAVGGVLILVGGVMFGFNIAKDYTKKLNILRDFIVIFESMKSYIGYSSFKLCDVFDNVLPLVNQQEVIAFIKKISFELKENNNTFEKIWLSAMEDSVGKYINGDVREIITSFSGITGYMDKSSQINFIELICDKLNQKERNVTKETREKVRISRMTGLFAGLLVVIILL